MKTPSIIAYNVHGTRIPGPDCEKHPGCLTRIHTYLDFGKPSHADTPGAFSARFGGSRIREAMKKLILALRAHRPHHNDLLGKEIEMLRPPMPPDVLAAQEAMGPPRVFFIPCSSNTSGEGGAPPGMKALHEIRMTRTIGNPDPEELSRLQEQLEHSWNKRDDMRLLLRFLWHCRNWAEVTIVCRPHA